MDIGATVFGLALTALGGVVAAVGLSSLRQWYALGRRDTVSIHDAALEHGPAEVTGTVDTIGATGLEAPLTGTGCVAYEYTIERRSGDSWSTVDQGEDCQPFVLSDGRETAYVDPEGASLALERERIEDIDRESLPDEIETQSSLSGRRRYVERRLDVGSTGLVHGDSEPSSNGFADVQFTSGETAGLFLVGDSTASTLGRRFLLKGVALTPLGGLVSLGGLVFVIGGLW